MTENQVKGIFFEEIVKNLMERSGYIDIKSSKILGRGADHQIDSYGIFKFTIPFIYPIRLISEAKWHSNAIGLPTIRNFVGVMKDISENYYVPNDIRSNRCSSDVLSNRYTDCGAIFSANPFTSNAQRYAWAHGIYLIPFSKNSILAPLLSLAVNDIRNLTGGRLNNQLKKSFFHAKAKECIINMSNNFDPIYSYVGILDGIYPIFIISDKSFDFDHKEPDEIERQNLSVFKRAQKEFRIESKQDVLFRFRYRDGNFEFTLPSTTSRKIISAIERTYTGEPFSYIDIPIELKRDEDTYRRVFRLKLINGYNVVKDIPCC